MAATAENKALCCRACRKPLFLATQLAPAHERPATASARTPPCTSYFLDALPAWVADVATSGAVEGKLVCACGSKFGSFNWSGAQCSCGAWVVPAIQVPKSRVDARATGLGGWV